MWRAVEEPLCRRPANQSASGWPICSTSHPRRTTLCERESPKCVLNSKLSLATTEDSPNRSVAKRNATGSQTPRIFRFALASLVAVIASFWANQACANVIPGVPGEWVWEGGSNTLPVIPGATTVGWPGVYASLGTPASANAPGGRQGAMTWTDSSGHLWLYGGWGIDANGTPGTLGDLWKFPSWGGLSYSAWMAGSNPADDTQISWDYGQDDTVYVVLAEGLGASLLTLEARLALATGQVARTEVV